MKSLVFYSIFLFLLSILFSSTLWSAENTESADALKKLLSTLNTLNTAFEQTVYSAEGDIIQQTSGYLQAARPGKVRWSTEPPMEQLVVSDGSTLWVYDPDLEQVVIRPFDQNSKTPAALFIGNISSLEKSYNVVKEEPILTEGGSSLQFFLVPIDTASLYSKLALGFIDDKPSFMMMWDTLEQKTEIIFQRLQLNQSIAPGTFQFSPPEGTDIIRDE